MKKTLTALAIFCAISNQSFAVTTDTSNPLSKVVYCYSSDSFDQCSSAIDHNFRTDLASTRAKWKTGYLTFKPGNIVTAYQNGVNLGDFPITLIRAISIANRDTAPPPYYSQDGEIELIAGGLYIKIYSQKKWTGTSFVTVCINNECQQNTY